MAQGVPYPPHDLVTHHPSGTFEVFTQHGTLNWLRRPDLSPGMNSAWENTVDQRPSSQRLACAGAFEGVREHAAPCRGRGRH